MKHHFANSSEPLKEGAKLKTVCGEMVVNSSFVALLDCAVVGYSFAVSAIRGMCRKCNNGDLPKRFVYIVCEGQEAKTEDVA